MEIWTKWRREIEGEGVEGRGGWNERQRARSQGESDRQAGSPGMMLGGEAYLGGTIEEERKTRNGDNNYNDAIPMQVAIGVGCW